MGDPARLLDGAAVPSRAEPGARPNGPPLPPSGPALPPSGPALPPSGLAWRLAAGPCRWLARRTLRGRLIAGLLALLTLACAVIGGATYLAVNRFLLIQLDTLARHGHSCVESFVAGLDIEIDHAEDQSVAQERMGLCKSGVQLDSPAK